MIKMIVSDLDGTLLNEDHQIDENIHSTIKKIADAGIMFVVATGRSLHSHEVKRLGFEPYYRISMNGAMITSPDNEVLYAKAMDLEFIRDLSTSFPKLDINYSGITYTYVMSCYEEKIIRFYQRGFKEAAGDPSRIADFLGDFKFDQKTRQLLEQSICKVDFKIDETEKMDELLKRHAECLSNAPAYEGSYEITANGVNKAMAIKRLCKMLNIKEDEIIVFGDGGNDIEMLSQFESYCTSNGCDAAKKAAKHHIGSNADYAVLTKIEEILEQEKGNNNSNRNSM